MGGGQSTSAQVALHPNAVVSCRIIEVLVDGNVATYKMLMSVRGCNWVVLRRFSDCFGFLSQFSPGSLGAMRSHLPAKTVFRAVEDSFLQARAVELGNCVAAVVGSYSAWQAQPHVLCEFCEISLYSLSPWLGRKGHEGYIRKFDGGRILGSNLITAESLPFAKRFMWQTQWVALKDSAIIYSDTPLTPPRGVMPVDKSLQVSVDAKRHITVSSSDRRLRLFARSEDEMFRWVRGFRAMYGDRVALDSQFFRPQSATAFARTGGDLSPEMLLGRLGSHRISTAFVSGGARRIPIPGSADLLLRFPLDENRHTCSRLGRSFTPAGMNTDHLALRHIPRACSASSEHPQGVHLHGDGLESEVSCGPTRSCCACIPLLCGRDYFACAARAILDARQQILITGWWMDIDIPLVRQHVDESMAEGTRALGVACGPTARAYPAGKVIARATTDASAEAFDSVSGADIGVKEAPVQAAAAAACGTGGPSQSTLPDEAFSLKSLLRLKAEQAVQIFVLLYKEMPHVGMDNNSGPVKEALSAIHPNIHVMRHPNQIIGAVGGTGHAVAQSHHEKLLVVDSAVGFVGGIDMAPGRYCDPRRLMGDPGGRIWKGHDYHNPQGISGLQRWRQLRAASVAAIEAKEQQDAARAASAVASTEVTSPGAVLNHFFSVQLPSFFQVPAQEPHKVPPSTAADAYGSFSSAGTEQVSTPAEIAAQVAASAPHSASGESDPERWHGAVGGVVRGDVSAAARLVGSWEGDLLTEEAEAVGHSVGPQSIGEAQVATMPSAPSHPVGVAEAAQLRVEDLPSVPTTAVEVPGRTTQREAVAQRPRSPKSLARSRSHSQWSLPPPPPSGPVDLSRMPASEWSSGSGSHTSLLQRVDASAVVAVDTAIRHRESMSSAREVTGAVPSSRIREGLEQSGKKDPSLGVTGPDTTDDKTPPGASGKHVERSSTLRSVVPRMPWHDVQVAVGPEAAIDLAFHFAQRWDHHKASKNELQQPVIVPASDSSHWVHRNQDEFSPLPHALRAGAAAAHMSRCDAAAAASAPMSTTSHIETPGAASTSTPASGAGESASVQRSRQETRAEEAALRRVVDLQCPGEYLETLGRLPVPEWWWEDTGGDDTFAPAPRTGVGGLETESGSKAGGPAVEAKAGPAGGSARSGDGLPPAMPLVGPSLIRTGAVRKYACSIQVLRQAGSWSLGVPGPSERGIANAYCQLIENAKHFVYIENQFFISSCGGDGALNTVGESLIRRVTAAIQKRQAFKAIIIVPAYPEGDISNNSAMRCVAHYQLRSIARGPKSVLAALAKAFPSVRLSDYITFLSLRVAGRLPRGLATEQLYVHSKVLVVDDTYAVVGSANMNDRSLWDEKDTEVAVLIGPPLSPQHPTDGMVNSRLAGQAVWATTAVHSMRRRLWRMHLGLPIAASAEVWSKYVRPGGSAGGGGGGLGSPADAEFAAGGWCKSPDDTIDLADPCSDTVYRGLILASARHNTRYFERNFPGARQFTDPSYWGALGRSAGGQGSRPDVASRTVLPGPHLQALSEPLRPVSALRRALLPSEVREQDRSARTPARGRAGDSAHSVPDSSGDAAAGGGGGGGKYPGQDYGTGASVAALDPGSTAKSAPAPIQGRCEASDESSAASSGAAIQGPHCSSESAFDDEPRPGLFHSPLDPPLEPGLQEQVVAAHARGVVDEQGAMAMGLRTKRGRDTAGMGVQGVAGSSFLGQGTVEGLVERDAVGWAGVLREEWMGGGSGKCSDAHVSLTCGGGFDGGSGKEGAPAFGSDARDVSGYGPDRPVGCLVMWSAGLAVGRQLESEVIRWLPAGLSPKSMLM